MAKQRSWLQIVDQPQRTINKYVIPNKEQTKPNISADSEAKTDILVPFKRNPFSDSCLIVGQISAFYQKFAEILGYF